MRFIIRDDENFVHYFSQRGVWYCLDSVYYYRKEDTFLATYIWGTDDSVDVFEIKRSIYVQGKNRINSKVMKEFETAYKEGLRKEPELDYYYVGDHEELFTKEESKNDKKDCEE